MSTKVFSESPYVVAQQGLLEAPGLLQPGRLHLRFNLLGQRLGGGQHYYFYLCPFWEHDRILPCASLLEAR